MGACYSKKSGQVSEAYNYSARHGSPARLRKKSAMNRTAPYPRPSAPPHSFGFRRRPAPLTSHRVAAADSARPARRLATTVGSQESVNSAASSTSDANGNLRASTIPARRQLPRPQVAHVKPRTSGGAARAGRPPAAGMDDSGVGTLRGSLTSAASDAEVKEEPPPPPPAPPAAAVLPLNVGAGSEDFQVGIRTSGATIALSVNIHTAADAGDGTAGPQVTISDPDVRARVTQVQRPSLGFTHPAGLTRPSGAHHAHHAHHADHAHATTAVPHMSRPARTSLLRLPAARGAAVARRAGAPAAVTDHTVRSRVTRWEEKVHQVTREALTTAPPPARRGARQHQPAAAASVAGLRREMRQLTRDVATSPLRRPPLCDTGTCTDLSPPAALHESRGAEDFIDDEIGDQPAFGGAFHHFVGGVASPDNDDDDDAFIDDVIGDSVGLGALPPLEISELLTSRPADDYVRPFRLTPRPLPSLTTLETPLRRPPAEPATSSSERRQQMEERAERLARRLLPGAAGDYGRLSSTCQRLGLPEPLPEPAAGESRDASSAELSLSRDSSSAEPLLSRDSGCTEPPPPRDSGCAEAPASRASSPADPLLSRDSGCTEPRLSRVSVCSESPASRHDGVDAAAPRDHGHADRPVSRDRDGGEPPASLCADGVVSPPAAANADREDDSFSDLDEAVLSGCRPRGAPRPARNAPPDLVSPVTSITSDDLMADFEKDSDTFCEDDDGVSSHISRLQRMRLRGSTDGGRPSPDPELGATKLLRPPRQSSQQDGGDWMLIDRDTYMYMAQDFTHAKTMLHKLRRVLQDTQTANPFEQTLQSGRRGTSVSSESQLSTDDRRSIDGGTDLAAENADLKRQVAALQQQLEEKEHTIHLLQQQMGKYSTSSISVSTVSTQAGQVLTDDPHVITVSAGN